MRFSAALAAAAWLVAGWSPAIAIADAPLPADPAIASGVLANGMRYALMPNATPAGGLSMRLVMAVGSLDEDEGERGYAHFVEHMAFRATANFPEGRLEPAFARLGVAVGRDQNAFTSTERTLYQLDLSTAGPEARGLALRWLRDVADGVRFEPAAVERERSVVLAERMTRHDPDADLVEAIAAFQGPDLRTVRRSPIGDLAVVRAATPAALQAFHARWYRPEHAALVIVGATGDIAALEREIGAAFGDWKAAGEAPARPVLRGPDATRGLDALGRSDAKVAPGLSICRLAPVAAGGPATIVAARRRSLQSVWAQVLQTRLSRLDFTEPSILSAQVMVDPDQREAVSTCISASIVGEAWRPALKVLQAEIARMDADPTEEELDAALAELRGGLLGDIAEAATRSSPALADELAASQALGWPLLEPRQAMRLFNQAVDGVGVADVTAAWRTGWAGAGPFVSIAAAAAPARGEILAAWNDKTPPARAAAASPQWAYGAPGPPGRVVRREVLKAPDFVRLHFANGVVLNFKQTAFSKGKVEVQVLFGDGREGLGARPVEEGYLAASSFVLGGLGRHSYADLLAIYGEEPLKLSVDMQRTAFSFEADAYVDRLPQHLRLMAAYLSDPGFRDDMDAKLPTELANTYRTRRAAPLDMAAEEILRQRLPAGLTGPALQVYLAGRHAADFAGLMRRAATAAPIEATLVGDIDEAAAIELVAATLGALPARGAPAPAPSYEGYQRFAPTPPVAPVRVAHAGPGDKAAVAVVWPTFVADPARRRDAYAVELLSYVFDDALRREVRERLGKAYGPAVSFSAPDRADQGYLIAAVETGTADLGAVEAAVRSVAAELAAGAITEAMFAQARAPLLASAQSDLSDNAWIAWSLSGSARDPQGLRDLVEAPRVLADLSLDEIKRAAARWLSNAPLIVVAEPETRT